MKIICVGWNYRSHAAEMDKALPEEPLIFMKPSTCLIRDGEEIRIPEGVTNVQHEVELALVFGRSGKDISEEEAMSYVSGLAVFNDVTARDMQSAERARGNPWDLSKGMDTFGPMSDIVPAEGVDIGDLELTLTVNGEVRQKGNTGSMIFSPAKVIAFVSKYITIEAGDIMATGTPEGISEIKRGDTVCARISGVGSVTNRVV